MQTSVIGDPEIEVDTFQTPEIGPLSSLEWTTRYVPRDQGRDSAHFEVVYRPNIGAEPDTLLTKISGIGVEQLLEINSATGDPDPVTVRTDTIDFGQVDADGTGGVVATIVMRNEGNTNIRLTSEREVGLDRDTAAYVVERSLISSGEDIRTSSFDTLVVRFDPQSGGRHRMEYVIETDLKDRAIKGVPDGAQFHKIYFTGFSRKPQIQVSPASLEFGEVIVLPDCASASVRELTIRTLVTSRWWWIRS